MCRSCRSLRQNTKPCANEVVQNQRSCGCRGRRLSSSKFQVVKYPKCQKWYQLRELEQFTPCCSVHLGIVSIGAYCYCSEKLLLFCKEKNTTSRMEREWTAGPSTSSRWPHAWRLCWQKAKDKRQNRYNVQVKVRLKWMEVDIRLST